MVGRRLVLTARPVHIAGSIGESKQKPFGSAEHVMSTFAFYQRKTVLMLGMMRNDHFCNLLRYSLQLKSPYLYSLLGFQN